MRTSRLLDQTPAGLLGDNNLLDLLEQVLGLGQVQTQRVDVQVATFHLGHFVHDRRSLVVGFDDGRDVVLFVQSGKEEREAI